MSEYFSISVEDLKEKHKEKCKNRIKIYDKLLEKCFYRINKAADNDQFYYIYTIPDFVLGMATYNLAYCAAYIIHNLKNKGFYAKFFNPNIIFIMWNFNQSYININSDNRKLLSYDNKLLMPPSSNTIKESKIIEIPKIKKYRSINDYKPTGNFLYN
jgi:hypothetical protein